MHMTQYRDKNRALVNAVVKLRVPQNAGNFSDLNLFGSPEGCAPCGDMRTETDIYEGWNFNSGNYLFTTDTK